MGPKLTGAPAPYDGEPLYGALGRTQWHLGITSPKLGAEWQMGCRNALAIPDLPTRCEALKHWAKAEWAMELSDVVQRHTSLCYYTSLRGGEAYRNAYLAMLTKSSHLHVSLGLCASVVRDTTYFRYCEACVNNDFADHGESFWRLYHQLPGVLVCTEHEVPLFESRVRYRDPSRNRFVLADDGATGGDQIAGIEHNLTAWLSAARQSREFAETPPSDNRVWTDYRATLHEFGFDGPRGKAELERRISSHFGSRLLALFKGPDPLNWVSRLSYKPRRPLHPMQHIVLAATLEAISRLSPTSDSARPTSRRAISSSSVNRDTARRLFDEGKSIRSIAQTLGVSWKTASRMLEPLPDPQAPRTPTEKENLDQRAWLAHIEAYPNLGRKELRKLQRALYARLYRRDRGWLLRTGPRRTRAKPRRGRVDWAGRDAQIAQCIEAVAQNLRASEPRKRVSASRVFGELGIRALMYHRRTKLPMAWAAADRFCDEVADLQIARLANAVEELSTHGRAPDWMVLRVANINPDRFPDRAASLLHEARGRTNAA